MGGPCLLALVLLCFSMVRDVECLSTWPSVCLLWENVHTNPLFLGLDWCWWAIGVLDVFNLY